MFNLNTFNFGDAKLWTKAGFRSRMRGGGVWSVLGPFGRFCERGAGRAGRSPELHWLRPQVSAGIKPHLRPPGGAGAALSRAPAPGILLQRKKERTPQFPYRPLFQLSLSCPQPVFVVLVGVEWSGRGMGLGRARLRQVSE